MVLGFMQRLPEYLLEDSLLPCLWKHEQYQLLSTCRPLVPLLIACRRILITSDDYHTDMLVDYLPRSSLWSVFRDIEDYRIKLLDIVGCSQKQLSSTEATLTVTKSSHNLRKLSIRITIQEAIESSQLLLQYACFCDQIEVVENKKHLHRLIPNQKQPVVLSNPTSDTLIRWLASDWKQVDRYIDIHSLHHIAEQHLAESFDSFSQQSSTSLQSLRGIRALELHGDKNACWIEVGTSPMNALESVTLSRCADIIDLTVLEGIPSVALIECRRLHSLQALARANSIVLVSISNSIQDFSPFQHVQHITFEYMDIDDISMLHRVSVLVVRHCKVKQYPVPSQAKTQQWEFEHVDISDLSGYQSLKVLKISNCNSVDDMSMLTQVQSLTITDCGHIRREEQYPMLSGRLQSLHLIRMNIQEVSMSHFQHINHLTLEHCMTQKQLGLFQHIYILDLINCEEVEELSALQYIEYLRITSCGQLQAISEVLHVTHLTIERCNMLSDSKIVFNELTSLKQFKISDCHSFRSLNFLEPIVNQLTSLESSSLSYGLFNINIVLNKPIDNVMIRRCYTQPAPVTYYMVDSEDEENDFQVPLLIQSKGLFDNFSLRSAVALWCVDEERAKGIYGDIETWNVSQVTDMSLLFNCRSFFNDNINAWDVSNVTKMNYMFNSATEFDQPLKLWNTSKVASMQGMFSGALSFNQALDDWDVSNVVDMNNMFNSASSFNQPLASWNVSHVSKMQGMFYDAEVFDQPLDTWRVSAGMDLYDMFGGNCRFSQPLDSWIVKPVRIRTYY